MMADDRLGLPKRAAELHVRDVRKAGEEEDWKKKKTRDRGGGKKAAGSTSPLTKGNEEESRGRER